MLPRASLHKLLTLAAGTTLAALALSGCSTTTQATPSTSASITAAPSAAPSIAAAPSSTEVTDAPVELKSHTLANEHFELITPANWTFKKLELDRRQVHLDVAEKHEIKNSAGQTMATLWFGGTEIGDINAPESGSPYTQLEQVKAPLGTSNLFVFDALGSEGQEAAISIQGFDLSAEKSLSGIESIVHYENGSGGFYRNITKDDALTGVDPSLTGMNRLKSYAQTEEYAQIKAMMLSLKQTKISDSVASMPKSEGGCVGATYSYSLADSGLTCEEAKSFVQKTVGKSAEYGRIDLPGLGMCSPPEDGKEGWCEVSNNESFFFYQDR